MSSNGARKFYRSLELHREVARAMRSDPERIRTLGLAGVVQLRELVRGTGGHRILDSWESLLTNRDWDELREALTSEDEKAAEMRDFTVFFGVFSQERRDDIVREVNSRPGLLW